MLLVGYKVFAGARRVAMMDDLKNLGVITFELDVTIQESVDKVRQIIIETNGGETLDILINNAGITLTNSYDDMSMEQLYRLFAVNYFGTLRMIKTFTQALINSKHGKVIVTSSLAGVLHVPLLGCYSDTKAAIISLSRSLRTELEPFNVQVCCTITGTVASSWTNNLDKGMPDGKNAVDIRNPIPC